MVILITLFLKNDPAKILAFILEDVKEPSKPLLKIGISESVPFLKFFAVKV